ncbi:SDR family NAD(P)-dependent oxidoreductase [Streptomyces spinosus]|uniref:SDR family NAD(P)-dependent oxidoreductase n=1 Tax=Streptomyces spinosus TaxID=2872623 RepID=UPI001CED2D02|nr:SDR family NAD(P)-dependent oxidoreductase [Streptomyces spinosus]
MREGFKETTALITGGGTGIGRASALTVAAAGCTVTVAGRTETTLAVPLIHEADRTARHVQCDGGTKSRSHTPFGPPSATPGAWTPASTVPASAAATACTRPYALAL